MLNITVLFLRATAAIAKIRWNSRQKFLKNLSSSCRSDPVLETICLKNFPRYYTIFLWSS